MLTLKISMDLVMDRSFLFQSSVAVSACVASISLISWIVKGFRRSPLLSLPPGPRGLPIVGYLLFLGADLHLTFAKLCHIHGPIYKLWLGNKLYVVLSSPGVVKEVVREKDLIFANRVSGAAATILTYGTNDIAFRDYGLEWRKMRKIFVNKMLGNSALDASFTFRREAVRESVKLVYSKIGTPVNTGHILLFTVVNSMITMVCGTSSSLGMDKGKDWQGLMKEMMVLVAAPNLSDLFPSLAWLDLQGVAAKTKRVLLHFDEVYDTAIANIRQRSKRQTSVNFLEHLMGLSDLEDSSSSINMTQIKAILMDTVVGGTDTTSTILEWALSELLLHPKVMKSVQDELTQVVGLDSLVNESHLPKLRYLEAVVKETQRLHPAFPLSFPRRPSEDTEVGGYRIPKGTTVFIHIWAIHRDPTLWDKPLEFRPERFLDNKTKWDYSGKDLKYLPFGSGRRTCPGLPLAERAVMYNLAMFLHCFNWEVPKGAKISMDEKFGLVMGKKEPLIAIPTARLSNLELYK